LEADCMFLTLSTFARSLHIYKKAVLSIEWIASKKAQANLLSDTKISNLSRSLASMVVGKMRNPTTKINNKLFMDNNPHYHQLVGYKKNQSHTQWFELAQLHKVIHDWILTEAQTTPHNQTIQTPTTAQAKQVPLCLRSRYWALGKPPLLMRENHSSYQWWLWRNATALAPNSETFPPCDAQTPTCCQWKLARTPGQLWQRPRQKSSVTENSESKIRIWTKSLDSALVTVQHQSEQKQFNRRTINKWIVKK
jgi:hypothetical protein